MEWWNVDVMIVTLVATGGACLVVLRRLIRREYGTLREDFGAFRKENREAHEKIGGQISDLRNGLRGDIADLREDISDLRKGLGGDISDLRKGLRGDISDLRKELGDGVSELREGLTGLREGQADLREGIAGLQGEMNGMRDAHLALRKDFRAHVLAKR